MVNWVDLVIILILGFFVLESLKHTLFAEVIDLLSFFISFFLSFRYYNLVSKVLENQFHLSLGLSLAIGFLAIWFLSESLLFIIVRSIISKIPIIKIPGQDFLAVFPAFLRGLIFVALFLVMVATFPIQPAVKLAVQESKIGSLILKHAYGLEKPLKSVFGGITNETLTFLTIEPKTNESVNIGFKTSKFSIDEAAENEMIILVNKERTERGLKALTFDPKLREVARPHSADMFTRGYFSHYSPEGETVADRASKANVDYLIIGENLAYAPDLPLAHQGLMNSPGHRANILSTDFNKIGIGVMNGGVYGRMFTQVFSN